MLRIAISSLRPNNTAGKVPNVSPEAMYTMQPSNFKKISRVPYVLWFKSVVTTPSKPVVLVPGCRFQRKMQISKRLLKLSYITEQLFLTELSCVDSNAPQHRRNVFGPAVSNVSQILRPVPKPKQSSNRLFPLLVPNIDHT